MRLGAPPWALTDVGGKPTTSSGVRRAATTPHLAGWFENRMIYIIVAPCPLFATTALLSQFGQCEGFERRTLGHYGWAALDPSPEIAIRAASAFDYSVSRKSGAAQASPFSTPPLSSKISREPTPKDSEQNTCPRRPLSQVGAVVSAQANGGVFRALSKWRCGRVKAPSAARQGE